MFNNKDIDRLSIIFHIINEENKTRKELIDLQNELDYFEITDTEIEDDKIMTIYLETMKIVIKKYSNKPIYLDNIYKIEKEND